MTEIDRIIKFFLHIFQLQSGVLEEIEAAGEYRLVSSESHTTRIYELRVKQLSAWKTRRMSIRRISDSVESKSTCYVVTFDDLLVIKIPPAPLTDFAKYLESINIEIEVAKQLKPEIHCLSPSLSSILQKVPELAAKIPEDAADVEAIYIELLTKEPRHQGHLKIGDRFAFFMSLSKHPFLNQIIEKIHGDSVWIQDEMFKNSRIFQSLEAFESVYGSKRAGLYEFFHAMTKDFSRKADAMLTLYGSYPPIPDYQKQEWVFAALAKKPVHFNADEIPTEICEDIGNLLSALIQEKKEWVDDYRKVVSTYIRKKNFNKNRKKIEALIIRTLELIYRLKNSKVTIRDLKPDNILVMGKTDDVYSYLTDPDRYDLGLIDLETAVSFYQADPQQFRQPMLAGTSVYMTPSHIFPNNILINVYGKSFPRVFYMQDWFATVGIIHDVVKGRWLFKKTSKLIPEIARARKSGKKNNIPMSDIFMSVSRAFWKTAEDELSAAIEKDKETFQLILLELPEHIVDMFLAEINQERLMLSGVIQGCAVKFPPKNAQKFISATYEEIRGQREKLERGVKESSSSKETHQNAIDLLKRIETMKLTLKSSGHDEKIIKKPISGDDLMKFMFQRVCNTMNSFA